MKRTPLSRKSRLSVRNGIKPVARAKGARWDGLAWQRSVAEMHGVWSLVSGLPAETAHHACTKQTLRHELGYGDAYERAIRDPRNGVPLTNREHDRHHSRSEPLGLSVLPESVFVFADELGLGWWLLRTYNNDGRQ